MEHLPILESDALSLSHREIRLLKALYVRDECSRHDLDRLIGAENSPHNVMQLRNRFGLEIPMVRRRFIDRDGRRTYPGYYSLNGRDRQRLSLLPAIHGDE